METTIFAFKTFSTNINFTTSIKTSNLSISEFLNQNSNLNNVLQMPTQDLLKTHHSTAIFFLNVTSTITNTLYEKETAEQMKIFQVSLV